MSAAVRSTVTAAFAACLSAWLCGWVVRHVALPAPLRLVIAVLPAPIFLWFIITELHVLRRLDEFHRRVVLDAFAIAFPAAILAGVTIDALQKGGFVSGWTVGNAWPFMALLWLPSLWVAYRRYDRGE